MKFRHNKKRNTAFIYEVLIVEYSKATMVGAHDKKNKLINLLKENFSKGNLLKKDLDIYRSFEKISDLDDNMKDKLIQEAKVQFSSLNRGEIFSQQTSLINEINKNFGYISNNAWAKFAP